LKIIAKYVLIVITDSDIAKKLKVQIKPLSPTGTQPSANVDDIRTSMGMLRLSPTVGVSYL
jgi:hypothetical protein